MINFLKKQILSLFKNLLSKSERKIQMQKDTKWNFDHSYGKLPELFFTKQKPTPVKGAKEIIFNKELAHELKVPLQLEVFAGNVIPEGAMPLAQAYAGHQFGYFTMLGDGRALLLGEHLTPSGTRVDIQLKGSGRTPYSRGGDGRAAIGPMLREYIISEAMHALGIPTTRSLAVVKTGEWVMREEKLQGAILTRVAASHLRVGTFEYATHFGSFDDTRSLADYTIIRHFPSFSTSKNKYRLMLEEVIKRQAVLISKWQLVGFIHGVMNTDNMAISGETIDYGPCAFMDSYDPTAVFSFIDKNGRYAYENQPQIALWNLARFAESLLPLLHEDIEEAIKLGQVALKKFWDIYQAHWLAGMRAKLGLFNIKAEDELLIKDILQLMQQYQADYTFTFYALTLAQKGETALFSSSEFNEWHQRWQMRLSEQAKSKDEIKALMKCHNPAVIPRNHRVEAALDAAKAGDLTVMNKLLDVLSHPYGYTAEQEADSKPPAPTTCPYQTFCGT